MKSKWNEMKLRKDSWKYAKEIQNGKYYDTGDKLEYLKTTLDFGLSHPELGAPLRQYLRDRLES